MTSGALLILDDPWRGSLPVNAVHRLNAEIFVFRADASRSDHESKSPFRSFHEFIRNDIQVVVQYSAKFSRIPLLLEQINQKWRIGVLDHLFFYFEAGCEYERSSQYVAFNFTAHFLAESRNFKRLVLIIGDQTENSA